MATVAVGDIHGNLPALEDLLEKTVPTLNAEDTLVFLGDYIDRGKQSRECLERLVRLERAPPCRVVFLLGNHEYWLLKTQADHGSHSWIFAGQGFTTIESYSQAAAAILEREIERLGPRMVTERASLPYEVLFDAIPPDHIAFLASLKPYHQTEDVLCVHGGCELDGRLSEQRDSQRYIWGPDGFPEQYRSRVPVVYGHWDNAREDETGWPWPRVMENRTHGVDTISKGVLTAMRFPDAKIFQSERYLITA